MGIKYDKGGILRLFLYGILLIIITFISFYCILYLIYLIGGDAIIKFLTKDTTESIKVMRTLGIIFIIFIIALIFEPIVNKLFYSKTKKEVKEK